MHLHKSGTIKGTELSATFGLSAVLSTNFVLFALLLEVKTLINFTKKFKIYTMSQYLLAIL
jgi:hypothetical protein